MTTEQMIARGLCLESLEFFTRYFFQKRFNKKFIVAEHHKLIFDALEKVIKGETKRLIINIAPRYGKTELAVKNFIAYGLAINPAARFIHLSYSDDLALDNSEEVRDMVGSEEYRELFGVKIKPKSDAKKKWYTTESGGVYATSTGGQVTGFGAGHVDEEFDFIVGEKENVFAGALIIDDPIKPEDGDSDLIRERINTRFDSTIRNRVNSRNTPIIIIMQRIHENDLCGDLLEKEPDDWTVLSLPAIKEDGTALWPHKHTLEELEKIRKKNEIIFSRQYLQDPMPLFGRLFPESELRYYRPDPLLKFETSFGYIDTADEGKDSLAALSGRNIKTDIYIPKVIFSKKDSKVTMPQCAELYKNAQASHVRVESNNMGAMYGKFLQDLIPNTQVLLVSNTTNKHTRIITMADFIKKHCVFLHPDYWDEDYRAFMKELCKYMREAKSDHDDAPDSLSGLAIFIRSMLSHLY